ncbi:hypothetical protein [Leptodesmis sp.]|uniref:hypothetical protein n=1 Tax=Leptodesmis sp. TaxID=3100501 RepID=UPI0040534F12
MTGHVDEEAIAFGTSEAEAVKAAVALLVDHYGCAEGQAEGLVQKARIEPVSIWCTAPDGQSA